ncbi:MULTISPECIES: N-acetylmuramoyl-L-alanine amidase [unclassified Shouchella]|uniref:N-acetylmuramoyl-L-alanine amidase n=1 Tax=unclassified Shouchella TaxID=2893065 RepID=UPI0039A14516
MCTGIGGINNGIKANRPPSNKYELTVYGAFSILYYVHATANTTIGAHVEMAGSLCKRRRCTRQADLVAYHVDDTQATQHLPFDGVGWRASFGNQESIGIEICVNPLS